LIITNCVIYGESMTITCNYSAPSASGIVETQIMLDKIALQAKLDKDIVFQERVKIIVFIALSILALSAIGGLLTYGFLTLMITTSVAGVILGVTSVFCGTLLLGGQIVTSGGIYHDEDFEKLVAGPRPVYYEIRHKLRLHHLISDQEINTNDSVSITSSKEWRYFSECLEMQKKSKKEKRKMIIDVALRNNEEQIVDMILNLT
jgi:hypothetical protein